MVLAHNINEGLRTQDVQISEDITFDKMLLTPNTLEGLTKSGFYKPSPIQLHGIPLGKCGFDLLLEAKSGTGKTAVFTVIALEKLDLEKGLQTIILAPTREIAAQICDVISQIGSNYNNLQVEVVIGGLPVQEDIVKFKKRVHIVVGSPGRLRHLIEANHIDLSAVRLFVLDEADKLMDKNFQADINYIFSVAPKEKQVIMSSATYPENLICVMNKYVQNAQHICPDSTNVLLGVKQLFITVKQNSNIVRQTQNRFKELLKILSKKNFKQCLIFCNYQVRVKDLCKMLMREKWPAEQLHGQQEQTDRLDALRTLQEYKCRILISTDIAARGIDASNVDLVINFEPPYDWQTYLHRIGRAGRFGSNGIAVTILSEGQEVILFKKIIMSINSSLDLRNLWDNNKLDMEECDSLTGKSIIQDIKSNYIYNELLNKLTQGEVKDVEETESFETLCDSFNKNKKSEIESFDDLLTCFKSHKVNTSDSSVKKFNTEPNNEFTSILNNQTNLLANSNIKTEENVTKSRDKIKLINEMQNPTPTHNVSMHNVEVLSVSNKEYNNKLKSQKNSEHGRNVTQLNQDINIHNGLQYSELDESQVHKAMLEAGLPTSFSSSKCSTRIPKKLHSQYLNINRNKCYTNNKSYMKSEETGRGNKHLPAERKPYLELDRERYFIIRSNSDHYGKKIYSKELHTDSGKIRNRKIKNNHKLSDYSNTAKTNHEVEINEDIHRSYVIWYNHLKTHIEHIQMSLYIEELSKI